MVVTFKFLLVKEPDNLFLLLDKLQKICLIQNAVCNRHT